MTMSTVTCVPVFGSYARIRSRSSLSIERNRTSTGRKPRSPAIRYPISMSNPVYTPVSGSRSAIPGWSSFTPMSSSRLPVSPACRSRSSLDGGPVTTATTVVTTTPTTISPSTTTSRVSGTACRTLLQRRPARSRPAGWSVAGSASSPSMAALPRRRRHPEGNEDSTYRHCCGRVIPIPLVDSPTLLEEPADVGRGQCRGGERAIVHEAVEQRGLGRFEGHHLLLDGVLGDQPVDHHLPGLADPVHPVDG